MRVRRMAVLAPAVVVMCLLPAVAWASTHVDTRSIAVPRARATRSGNLPLLLVYDLQSTFAVRPAMVSPSGDGWMYLTGGKGQNTHIHWRRWTHTEAFAHATLWMRTGVGMKVTHRPATIRAFRVRHGRFTRMTVRYHAADDGVGLGTKLFVDRYRLSRNAPNIYAWA